MPSVFFGSVSNAFHACRPWQSPLNASPGSLLGRERPLPSSSSHPLTPLMPGVVSGVRHKERNQTESSLSRTKMNPLTRHEE